MSASSETPWYRLGYALEAARREPTRDRLARLGERLAAFRSEGRDTGDSKRPVRRSGRSARAEVEEARDGAEIFDRLLLGGGAALAVRLLRGWPTRRHAGWQEVARGAVAGAGATLLREMTAPLLRGRLDAPTFDEQLGIRLLSGAARGALFGGFVEPRLPGGPLIKGSIYGSIEYLAAPWGGLSTLLGSVAPWSRLPALRRWIGGTEPGEDSFLEHLVFGMALALLAGAAVELGPLLEAEDDEDDD